LITKPTQIEFGNLSRGANNPILIKEKTDENGNTILRIYQRKDLQSISNPFEKIKNTLKYTLEDFGREHKTAAKLLEKIGFGTVRVLATTGTEQAADLIETMRSGFRTGLIEEKTKQKFDDLLRDNKITDDSNFIFHEDTYSDQNFNQDLIYIGLKTDPYSPLDLSNEFNRLKHSIGGKIFEHPLQDIHRLEFIIHGIEEIREKVALFFYDNNTNDLLQEKFFEKLDKSLHEQMLIAFGPENTKKWLIQYEKELSEVLGNTDNQAFIKAQDITINTIKTAFSNHRRDSDEKKVTSMIALQSRYRHSEVVPEIIKAYIEFSIKELLKKNPSLREKAAELQEVHAEE
jgi:hypothetical protein